MGLMPFLRGNRRIDGAANGPVQHCTVLYAANVAGDARTDTRGLSALRLIRPLRIGDQTAADHNKVGFAVRDQIIRHLGIAEVAHDGAGDPTPFPDRPRHIGAPAVRQLRHVHGKFDADGRIDQIDAVLQILQQGKRFLERVAGLREFFKTHAHQDRIARPDRFAHLVDHETAESGPVFGAAAEFVRAMVPRRGQKLVDEIAMPRMDLDCVKAGRFCPQRSFSVLCRDPQNFFPAQRLGVRAVCQRQRGRGNRRRADARRNRRAARVVDLHGGAAAIAVHFLVERVQRRHEAVLIEPELRRAVCALRVVHTDILHDDQAHAARCPQAVILDMLPAHLAAAFCIIAAHRRHDDAVFQLHGANAKRGKKMVIWIHDSFLIFGKIFFKFIIPCSRKLVQYQKSSCFIPKRYDMIQISLEPHFQEGRVMP